MGRTLSKMPALAWALALGLGCLLGCRGNGPGDTPQPPEVQAKRLENLRADAREDGRRLAKQTIFVAQEINLLDPRSERAESSRKARQLLEQITAPAAPTSQQPALQKSAAETLTPSPQKTP